jgi:hypothetical protein
LPLFTEVRGIGVLRTSENSVNAKFAEFYFYEVG